MFHKFVEIRVIPQFGGFREGRKILHQKQEPVRELHLDDERLPVAGVAVQVEGDFALLFGQAQVLALADVDVGTNLSRLCCFLKGFRFVFNMLPGKTRTNRVTNKPSLIWARKTGNKTG